MNLSLVVNDQDQQPAPATVEFEDFWLMYPRRVAKKDARNAWNKIPPKFHTQILTALFEWRRIWADRNELEFVPYPATWLNGERWEDEFPPHHRPYAEKTAAVVVKESLTTEPAKPMPSHVLEALKRMRAR